MRTALACLLLTVTISACGGKPGSQHHSAKYAERETLAQGLIQDEEAKLSNEAIARLLSSKIEFRDKPKLAIVDMGHESFDDWLRSYGPQYHDTHIERETMEFLRAQRRAVRSSVSPSGQFIEVTHVPALLLPEEPGLTQLRETAALMQADLLLVHRSRSQVVDDYRLFSPSEFTARVVLETALVDVLTGAIPFAETYDVSRKVSSSGRTWNDARKLAEEQAVTEATTALGRDITAFLKPLHKH